MFTCAKFHSRNLVVSQVTSTRTAQHTANDKRETRRAQVSKTIHIYIDFRYAGVTTVRCDFRVVGRRLQYVRSTRIDVTTSAIMVRVRIRNRLPGLCLASSQG